jgi:hypothetical protein
MGDFEKRSDVLQPGTIVAHNPYNPDCQLARGYGAMCNCKPTKTRNGSPLFYSLLEQAADIHDKKSHDYANNDNPYGNYYFSGELASLFSHSPKDAGFVGRIGEKLYRIANLEKDNKTAINENIEDTEVDIVTIVVLWIASRRERRNKK